MHENEVLRIIEKLQDDVSGAEDAIDLTFEHLYGDLADVKEVILKRIKEQDEWANREELRKSGLKDASGIVASAKELEKKESGQELFNMVKSMADAMIKIQRLQAGKVSK